MKLTYNVQNLPSGRQKGQSKALRTAIIAPPGYTLVGYDSAQGEIRCVDYIAAAQQSLQNFRNGICPYSSLAARMFNEGEAEQIKRDAKAGVGVWPLRRQIAKSARIGCLAGDTQVLTLHGWRALKSLVGPNEYVWNGDGWASVGRLVRQGVKGTMNFAGVICTPDHKIYDGEAWVCAEDADETKAIAHVYGLNPAGETAAASGGAIRWKWHGSTERRGHDCTTPRDVYDLVDVSHGNKFVVRGGSDLPPIMVHNCNYLIGPPKFKDYAKTSAGLSITLDESKGYVHGFRNANPEVVRCWDLCERVMHALIRGEQGTFGGTSGTLFQYDGKRTVLGVHLPGIRMPDGMWLSYPGISTEPGQYGPSVFYMRTKGRAKFKSYVHKGLALENLTQALLASVMKYQATLIPYNMALHTHDEHLYLVPDAEVDAAVKCITVAMATSPPWASDLPLEGEIKIGKNYGECK